MNNLANTRRSRPRAQLLATASTMALVISIYGADPANAGSEPPLWIELGWQSSTIHDSVNGFIPPFSSFIPQSGLTESLVQGLNLSHSYGDDAKISFRPENSDWVFAASVRYGRAKGNGSIKQTAPAGAATGLYYYTRYPERGWVYTFAAVQKIHTNYIHAQTHTNESHLIMDFQAGKDVGLGMFGQHSSSVMSVGLRFAQLSSAQDITNLSAVPDAHFQYFHQTADGPLHDHKQYGYRQVWHVLSGNSRASHQFVGMGPSLDWDASAAVAGDPKRGEVSLDWGINAALLFGRQKKNVRHNTSGQYHCYIAYYHYRCERDVGAGPVSDTSQMQSARHVLVPNLGGFISASLRWEDIKVSAGYRADFFFQALDAGGATRVNDTRGFYGPFANISVGMGD